MSNGIFSESTGVIRLKSHKIHAHPRRVKPFTVEPVQDIERATTDEDLF
jgi:hypothetical protein